MSNGSQSTVRVAVMESAQTTAGPIPTPRLRSLICPFCGSVTADTGRCQSCSARFDPLSRQATQNQMGPWTIRDERSPFRPGCTYETLVSLVEQGVVRAQSIIRGPTTRQFWTLATHTPSISQHFGVCHNCQKQVAKDSVACPSCQASFSPDLDRQHMGIGVSRALPGQGIPPQAAVTHGEASAESQKVYEHPRGVIQETKSGIGATDEAVGVIREWRHAFDAERRRAWVAVGMAGVITILAVVYGVMNIPGQGAQGESVVSVE